MAGVLCAPAFSHDIYTQEKRLPPQYEGSCCGGDKTNGDCEPLYENQVEIHPGANGMRIYSLRYKTYVEVSEPVIQYKVITGQSPSVIGHWCGVRKTTIQDGQPPGVDVLQPDPEYYTYCAFLSPGDT